MSVNGKKVVLITGAGGAAGVFLIKHLQKNNFKVVSVDNDYHATGLLHSDASYTVPLSDSVLYLDIIKDICNKENIDFIIPLIDEELKVMKSLEQENLKIICPTESFIEAVLDKFNLMHELSTLDLDIPTTFLFEEDYTSLSFPLIVKPRKGRGSRNVFCVKSEEELSNLISLYENSLGEFIVQEKIEGDEFTVSVVVNPDNELIAVIPKKIIEKKGITKSAVTELNESITEICEKITNELKPCSPYNVQLILNKKDNKPYIFEINPRFSTTVTLTIAAGIDEVMYPLNFYINPLKTNKEHRNFSSNLVLIRSTHEEYIDLNEYNLKKSKIRNRSC